MAEIYHDTPETLPPKRWHDVIRANFPGTMFDPDYFESFVQQDTHGVQYSLVSISKTDNNFKASEGIYIETNIPTRLSDQASLYIDNVITKLTLLLCEQGEPEIKTEIPDEIKDKIVEPGAYIDFGNAIKVEFFGKTGSGMIVFSLKPVGISEATAKLKESVKEPNSYTINRFK